MGGGFRKMRLHRAHIGLGSNLGDKRLNCEKAIFAITDDPKTTVNAQSPFYRTEPMYRADQDWFVNAVIEIDTGHDPEALLEVLQSVQRLAGRLHDAVRFGPRLLDLDILFYDDCVIQTPRLAVPHPRLHERRFVLQPLCDICPDKVHPVLKKDVKTLLHCLENTPGQMVFRL
jgi:2-amino-4-hydroxy-6-hydroxymethyldihydropteridine diphosphokinase